MSNRLKCKHNKCSRSAVDNGYCSECLQLPHLAICNYCSEVGGNKDGRR
jgi:hypothetical protein